jgi:tRNA ligase
MNEFEYTNGTLPTMARGLFTYQDPTAQCTATTPHDSEASNTSSHKDDGGIHRILIRGYDKFFNVGEVQKTKEAWIENNTEGPYEVTLKENGCIVFMAGLPPHLVGPQGGCVISSKHVISRNEQKEVGRDSDELHAAKGREWAERSLASKGKTLRDFGLWLWNQNLTAVAEVIDTAHTVMTINVSCYCPGCHVRDQVYSANSAVRSFVMIVSRSMFSSTLPRKLDYISMDSTRTLLNLRHCLVTWSRR